MDHMHHSRTRRSFVQMGLSAGLALVTLCGGVPLPDAGAEKKTKKKTSSVQSRNRLQKVECELAGGTLEANNMGGGRWETTCHGGSQDGYACTNSAKSTVCISGVTGTADGPSPSSTSPIADPWDIPTVPLEPADVTLTSYQGDDAGQSPHRGRRKHGRGRN